MSTVKQFLVYAEDIGDFEEFFDTEEEAKAYALEAAVTHEADYHVYQLVLVGRAEPPPYVEPEAEWHAI